MFCPNCGKEIVVSGAFCPECGQSLKEFGTSVTPINQPAGVHINQPINSQYNQYYGEQYNAPYNPPVGVGNNQSDSVPIYQSYNATAYNPPEDQKKVKKPTKNILAIILCALAAACLGVGTGLLVYNLIVDGPEEVAEKYMNAVLELNYKEIKNQLIFDIDQLYYDSEIIERMDDGELTEAEAVEDYCEDNDLEDDIDREDFFKETIKKEKELFDESNIEIEKLKIKYSYKMEEDEKEDFLEKLEDIFKDNYLDIDDYIYTDKIKEVYEVGIIYDLKCDKDAYIEYLEEKYSADIAKESYNQTFEKKRTKYFYVVKYGSSFKVLDTEVVGIG